MKLSKIISNFIDIFYIKPIRKFIPLQTFRYAACGGGNMLLDLFLYFIVYNFILAKQNVDLGIVVISPYIAAFMIVFPITFFSGFYLIRNIAFKYSPLKGHVQLFRYLLSVSGSILLNYISLKVLVEYCHIYPTPSKAITIIITVTYSYIAQKYFTFRGCADK